MIPISSTSVVSASWEKETLGILEARRRFNIIPMSRSWKCTSVQCFGTFSRISTCFNVSVKKLKFRYSVKFHFSLLTNMTVLTIKMELNSKYDG